MNDEKATPPAKRKSAASSKTSKSRKTPGKVAVEKSRLLDSKRVGADLKQLFLGLGETVAQLAVENGDSGVISALCKTVAAISGKSKPSDIAWRLIYSALARALVQLTSERVGQGQDVTDEDAKKLGAVLKAKLRDLTVGGDIAIDQHFFNAPTSLALLAEVKRIYAQWYALSPFYQQDREVPAVFADRLDSAFVVGLSEEWREHAGLYEKLLQDITDPFVAAWGREQDWMANDAMLVSEFDRPVFDEAFSLRQVYVPLRGVYRETVKRKTEVNEHDRQPNEPQVRRVVVDLYDEIEFWLTGKGKFDGDSQLLRLVSGTPGSGKSSFATALAANVVSRPLSERKLRILFFPMQRFPFVNSLASSVGDYLQSELAAFDYNPLDAKSGRTLPDNLLLVFDGLDELGHAGSSADDLARTFVQELRRSLSNLNRNGRIVRAIVTGRHGIMESAATAFRLPDRMELTVLPYYVPSAERDETVEGRGRELHDPEGLLETDQRDIWWCRYASNLGKPDANVPSVLKAEALEDLSAEPLLCYLLARSPAGREWQAGGDLDIAKIYTSLIDDVHERDARQGKPASALDREEFQELMESVGVACWHNGDLRTTDETLLRTTCETLESTGILDRFVGAETGHRSGLARLVAAFFFRAGQSSEQARGVQFAHKTFAEYFAAAALTRCLRDQIERRFSQGRARASDVDQSLREWHELCGETPISERMLGFLRGLVKAELHRDAALAGRNRDALQSLFNTLIVDGFSVESGRFRELERRARNAEEAMLALVNAQLLAAEQPFSPRWPDLRSAGDLLLRLIGQRPNDRLAFRCLSRIDFQNQFLRWQALWAADLREADLRGADLSGAHLSGAKLPAGFVLKASD